MNSTVLLLQNSGNPEAGGEEMRESRPPRVGVGGQDPYNGKKKKDKEECKRLGPGETGPCWCISQGL